MMADNMAETGPAAGGVVRAPEHARCWACGPENDQGLQVTFTAGADGAVTGTFACDEIYAGYPGFVQGGVVAALLDTAMTNCLFARGFVGVTADLQVRYLKPVRVGAEATIRAWLDRSRRLTHQLGAELVQDGEVVARAVGKFMQHPG